nr:PAS domain-containing protein [Halorubrum sp. CBA1125]
MQPGRDRELLAETLGDRYRVETTADAETVDPNGTRPSADAEGIGPNAGEAGLSAPFDCCVFDGHGFERGADAIEPRRELSAPAFLPFVLLVGGDVGSSMRRRAWNHVDDVIELPVTKAALRSRIGNLIERRRTSLRLVERECELERTVEDLQLKEHAMDEAPVGITIAEPGADNNPLTYLNRGFRDLTGYGPEMLGKDCRFLQGAETNPETAAAIREAIRAERSIAVDLLNYRSNGQKFWNRLTIAPIRAEDGTVESYVGFQTDITDRKIRERRLEVMNRVLNHNLRNKMNLISGYTELLAEETEGAEYREALDVITETADDLMRIAEAVRKIEHTLSATTETAITLRDRLSELIGAFRDRFPDATFELSLPEDDPLNVTVVGLVTAVEEGIENAVKHNDDPHPNVAVSVRRPSSDWIELEIEDNGPGIPDHEVRVLESGETSLNHADRLGIWLMYWVVNKAGGTFEVATSDAGGTVLRLNVPARP